MNLWEYESSSPSWDRPYQRRRRLSSQAEVIAALVAAFTADSRMASHLVGLHHEPSPEYTAHQFLFATWVPENIPVMIKLGAEPMESYWMSAIDRQAPGLVPRILAGGDDIGAYSVPWLVMEQIPQALSHDWGERMYDLLADAAARFQTAACAIDARYVSQVSFPATLASLQRALSEDCPGPLQRLVDHLDADWLWVNGICGQAVCFGDLTMGNARVRPSPGGDAVVLIDPLPRIAPWAWDAAYCQTLDANDDVRMVQRMAEIRSAQGLTVPEPESLDHLAVILLAWLAAHRWWNTAFRREDPAWVRQIERYIVAGAK